ncbi:DUF5685 family protein [Nonomuraea sp. NPDC048826]|uniref:DUF5685 family protein n=1 Tax=Nonomuraea sp. NPDC048826 TaxID=3364347 RepID=UPI0037179A3F
MFGIVRPCQHVMCKGLFADWMGHLCGLCLALRDEHGHLSRVVTNYDGLLVSVLTEAQAPATAPRRRAGACALRGFRRADVVEAEGVRLAASVSLLLAAGKVRDHVADGDGLYARRPVAAGAARLAERWSSAGAATAGALGFDPAPLREAARRQAVLERAPARTTGLRELTEPTEDAVAAAFAHTAVLTGKPHNREALEAAGRGFGRLAHLIDAVEDLDADRASGAYNPLAATGTTLVEARRHCDDALAGLRAAMDELEMERPRLARSLLVRETGRAVSRAFAAAEGHPAEPHAAATRTAGRHTVDLRTGGRLSGRVPDAPPGDPDAPSDDPGKPGGRPTRRDPGGILSFACTMLTCCSCGLYRPPWDEEHQSSCCQRFDCSGWDPCGSCCECGNCCGDGCCCDGCSCDC